MDDGSPSNMVLNSAAKATPVDANLETTAQDPSPLPWSRFRGPNGTGISNEKNIPTEWSDSKNLSWKTKLPGAGASSPVLTDRFVFVTSYSGYGEPDNRSDSAADLVRHLSCVDRQNGTILWSREIENDASEDAYSGMGVPEHGYATNSPVVDDELVFVFFGKSGVLAFDFEGKELWRVSVGKESSNRRWGSAASLTLYGDLVIVNAAEEGKTIFALKKSTGEVAWDAPAASLELCYGTPAIVHVDQSRDDLVLAVPGEIWGINPQTGKLTWYAETSLTGNLSPSVVVDGTTVYAFGGYRSSGSVALTAGGTGDITHSNILWSSRNSSYVATPVLLDGKHYWIDDKGMYYCSDAKNGELIHRDRVPKLNSGHPIYASPIAVNGHLYFQTRTSGVIVIEPSDEMKIVAQNVIESDTSVFNATPAVDNGQIFLRSDKFLYCIADPTVVQETNSNN